MRVRVRCYGFRTHLATTRTTDPIRDCHNCSGFPGPDLRSGFDSWSSPNFPGSVPPCFGMCPGTACAGFRELNQIRTRKRQLTVSTANFRSSLWRRSASTALWSANCEPTVRVRRLKPGNERINYKLLVYKLAVLGVGSMAQPLAHRSWFNGDEI